MDNCRVCSNYYIYCIVSNCFICRSWCGYLFADYSLGQAVGSVLGDALGLIADNGRDGPHKRVLLQGAAEFTNALFSEDENRRPVPVEFLKISALASGYIPLGPQVTLALSARGGRILHAPQTGKTGHEYMARSGRLPAALAGA